MKHVIHPRTYFASSSSSARAVPSPSNLARHICTSVLALDSCRCMSDLDSCSSSSCSRRVSMSAFRFLTSLCNFCLALVSSSRERLASSSWLARATFSLVRAPIRCSASSSWAARSVDSWLYLDLWLLRSWICLLASSILAFASESWLSRCLVTLSTAPYEWAEYTSITMRNNGYIWGHTSSLIFKIIILLIQ